MNPVNITYHNDYNVANYSLRKSTVKLLAKTLVGVRPDGDGWEEVWEESSEDERYRSQQRLRGSRKQKAARQAIPLATVKIVRPDGPPVDRGVAMALLADKSDDEVKVAKLEAEIRRLLGLVRQ